MPSELHNLVAEKAKAEIQIGGSTVPFVYYVVVRERFTDEEWEQLLGLRGRDYLKMLLPKVIVSWDIVEDGQPIPITAEAFDQFHIPDVILTAFERRVFAGDLAGKVPNSTNSFST